MAPIVLNKYKMQKGQTGVYVGRGTPFGNPFIMRNQSEEERNRVCDAYENKNKDNEHFKQFIRKTLKGKNLICFCAPKRCHADFLLNIANSEKNTDTSDNVEVK